MKPQDVASSRECVDEHANLKTNQGDVHNITRDTQNITRDAQNITLANHEP
jgi:hypothetical protein